MRVHRLGASLYIDEQRQAQELANQESGGIRRGTKSKALFVACVERPDPISSRENALKYLVPELPWVASRRGSQIYTARKNLTLSCEFCYPMQDACFSDPALTHKGQ